MPDRATTHRRDRATTPRGEIAPQTGTAAAVRSGRSPSSSGSSTLLRAVETWLADGKAQGWSLRTLKDGRQTLQRFGWWLEREESALSLSALTPARIRAFLTYAREPRPEGRGGSDRSAAKREARPATVHAYYRALRAFLNFCLAEGLLDEPPLKNVKAARVPALEAC